MRLKTILLFILINLCLLRSSQPQNLRVISTAPSVTEIIYALGAENMLVSKGEESLIVQIVDAVHLGVYIGQRLADVVR